jgi:mono/diheme cytochrome c family protein
MRIMLKTMALAALAAVGCWAADAKAGQAAYDKSCKSCHGVDGTPNAGVAKMMKVEMKDLKSPEVQGMSAADIKTAITAGKGKMKPVTTVSGAAVDEVIAYVKTLK